MTGERQESAQDIKNCPYCGEQILSVAIKCKHCGEQFDKTSTGNKKDETIAFLLLGIPMIASLLCWFWVGNMNLLQSPGSTLNIIIVLTVAITACLSAYEANRLGMGNEDDKNLKGKKRPGSIQWFFFIALMWIVGYPAYLYYRKKYGVKNLLFGGIFIAICFVASFFIVGNAINEQVADIQRTLGAVTKDSDIFSGNKEVVGTSSAENNNELAEADSTPPDLNEKAESIPSDLNEYDLKTRDYLFEIAYKMDQAYEAVAEIAGNGWYPGSESAKAISVTVPEDIRLQWIINGKQVYLVMAVSKHGNYAISMTGVGADISKLRFVYIDPEGAEEFARAVVKRWNKE